LTIENHLPKSPVRTPFPFPQSGSIGLKQVFENEQSIGIMFPLVHLSVTNFHQAKSCQIYFSYFLSLKYTLIIKQLHHYISSFPVSAVNCFMPCGTLLANIN